MCKLLGRGPLGTVSPGWLSISRAPSSETPEVGRPTWILYCNNLSSCQFGANCFLSLSLKMSFLICLPWVSSPVSSLLPVVSDASSVCTEQLYGEGNKSDDRSKPMHGIKRKVCFTLFWSCLFLRCCVCPESCLHRPWHLSEFEGKEDLSGCAAARKARCGEAGFCGCCFRHTHRRKGNHCFLSS